MRLKHLPWITAVLIVLAAAGYVRRTAFWAAHDDAVETGYAVLAMKMGTQPSLTGYQTGGTYIRQREVPETGGSGRMIRVVTPLGSDPAVPPTFDAWPAETNPFQLKPPFFPALLAFGHHRLLGPRMPVYPLLAGGQDAGSGPGAGFVPGSRAVFEVQAWAVAVPYLSGLAVILLVFLTGWKLSGPGAGLLAAVLTAAHPYQAHVAGHIWPEATLTACLLLTALILQFCVERGSRAGCFAAGIAFAMAFLTDHTALFALPAFWWWIAAAQRGTGRSLAARIFSLHAAAFGVGMLFISQSWIGHASRVLRTGLLDRSVPEGALGILSAAGQWAHTGAGFVIFSPFLLAALRPKGASVFAALTAASLVVMRWAYFPQAPWDERAWAAAVPFAALAAAPTLLSAVKKFLLKEKTA